MMGRTRASAPGTPPIRRASSVVYVAATGAAAVMAGQVRDPSIPAKPLLIWPLPA